MTDREELIRVRMIMNDEKKDNDEDNEDDDDEKEDNDESSPCLGS